MDRLAQLQAFCRVVEQGSFTAAARSLGVKQSTISKWVTALEAQHKMALVHRNTRSLTVTNAGQHLYQKAQALLQAYDDLVQPGQPERLRLSLPVVFGRRFVVPVLLRQMEEDPSLQLDLRFDDRYVAMIDEGFDLAVRIGQPQTRR